MYSLPWKDCANSAKRGTSTLYYELANCKTQGRELFLYETSHRNSLAVQRLRLSTSTSGGTGSIPGPWLGN